MSDPFENQLARTPRAPIDPAWRAEILSSAFPIAAAATPRRGRGGWTDGWNWAWATLAATWVTIFALNQLSGMPPRLPKTSQWSEAAASNLRLQFDARRRLLSTILDDPPPISPRTPPNEERQPPRGDRGSPGFGRFDGSTPKARV